MEPLQHTATKAAQARRSLITFFESEYGARNILHLAYIPPALAEPGHWNFAHDVQDTMARSLRAAELYIADTDMCALLQQAAPSMPDQPLRRDDPLSDHGVLVFREPFTITTPQGSDVPTHAFSWTRLPQEHGLVSDEHLPDGAFLLTTYGATHEAIEAGLDLDIPRHSPPRWFPSSTVIWGVGSPIGLVRNNQPSDPDSAAEKYQQYMAAFWALSKQPLTTTTTERPLRKQDVARYQRADIRKPNEVQIVRLRKRPGTSQTGEERETRQVDWQHQWIVSGHWKNQYYPSIDDHRQIYVAPYIKGPEDKPLKSGEKAILVEGTDIRPGWPIGS